MFLIQFTQIRPALHRSVADTMYTFAKDPLGLALLLAMTIVSSAILLVRYWLPAVALALEAVLLIVASYWRLDSIVMIQMLVACYAFARTARGAGCALEASA